MIHIRAFSQRHHRLLSAFGMLVLVGLIFWAVNSPALVGVSATQRQLPVYSVQRSDRKLAISFDAAWGNEDTQTLIDILGERGVRTTFFVVGDWAEKYPDSVKALAYAGHEVMSHSSHHDHFSQLSTEQITADLSACNEKIAAVTGVRPSLFRCPYGEYDDHVILAVRSLGLEPIQWSVERYHTSETRMNKARHTCARIEMAGGFCRPPCGYWGDYAVPEPPSGEAAPGAYSCKAPTERRASSV